MFKLCCLFYNFTMILKILMVLKDLGVEFIQLRALN